VPVNSNLSVDVLIESVGHIVKAREFFESAVSYVFGMFKEIDPLIKGTINWTIGSLGVSIAICFYGFFILGYNSNANV